MSDNVQESSERTAEPRSVEENQARREVDTALREGNISTGRDQFEESGRQAKQLERNGVLPSLKVDEAPNTDASQPLSPDQNLRQGKAGNNPSTDGKYSNSRSDAERMLSDFEITDNSAQPKIEPTGLTSNKKTSTPDCSNTDTTMSEGRKLPTLDVEQPGLPPNESRSSLTATPVDNVGRSDQRTLVTTAHGMVGLEKHEGAGNKYQLLDKGFQQTDTNGDGSLSREELQRRKLEGQHGQAGDPNSAESQRSASLAYQAQYALDNFDSIAQKSKEMDPSASGITNDGLAQHYLENAKITVRTASGASFKAEVASGDRNTDVAVLKTESLSPEQHEALGKNFQVSKTDPQRGDAIRATGHPRGTWGAEPACYKPTQSTGTVGDPQPHKLIRGEAIKHDAPTQSGMSGGPVLDKRRDHVVVGLNHSGDGANRSNLVPASAIREEILKAQRK